MSTGEANGELLTVEEARQMTKNRKGRCIGRQKFRRLVNEGVVPSWQDPFSPRGQLYIPRVAMEEWLRTIATTTPKRVAK